MSRVDMGGILGKVELGGSTVEIDKGLITTL